MGSKDCKCSSLNVQSTETYVSHLILKLEELSTSNFCSGACVDQTMTAGASCQGAQIVSSPTRARSTGYTTRMKEEEGDVGLSGKSTRRVFDVGGDELSQPACRISRSPECGRHLVAARDLAASELILRDAPTVVGPSRQQEHLVCVECFRWGERGGVKKRFI